MIFYVAVNEAGCKIACKTQDEARAVNKIFTKIDVPTDKDGLHALLQEFFSQLDTLKQEPAAPEPEAAPAPVTEPKRNHATQDLVRYCSELSERWPSLPWGLKSDLCCMFIEDLRGKVKQTVSVSELKEQPDDSSNNDHSGTDCPASDSPSPDPAGDDS